ncbi:MAG TPA: CHAT domain-containing protein [Terriglobales bacterium]|nr:CHAT domain-containing protein [Terriglobales bacterium]
MSAATAPVENLKALVQQLKDLSDKSAREEFLALNRKQVNLQVIIQLANEARELLRIDARQSLALSELALEIAHTMRDQLATAHAIRMKANALHHLGSYAPAVELHNQAIGLFELLGQEEELGRTLSACVLSLNLSGQYDAAFSAAERARTIFAKFGDELRLARLEINVGNVYYRQDRFADALQCYRRAYHGVIRHENREGIAAVLSNLSVCLISLGEFQQALDCYQHARDYCEKHGMSLLVAQADYNIAYLYFLRGEYSRAIDMLRSTRLRCNEIGDRYHYGLCNLDLSELYLELNLSLEAAELARLGYAEFEALGMGYEAAKSLAFEAIAMGQQGQAFQSLKLFTRSREMFVKEKNQVWPSLIDLYQALVLFNEARLFESRRLAKVALAFFESSLLPGKAVLCRLLLARIAQRTSDLATAHKECSAAIEKLKDIPAPMLRHQSFLLMGQIHSASGNREEAYECFRTSREALEMLRSNLRGQELKMAFLKNRLEVYELLVDSCLRGQYSTHSLAEAFSYIEEAKSRTLMDQMLQPVYSSGEESGQSDLVRRMRNLRDELNWYYSLIELEQLRPEQRSPEHIKRLEEQVRARETDLIRVLQESSVAEEGGPEMQSGKSLSIDEIRASITPETLIVEYFQTGDRILACLLGHEQLQIVPVTLATRIANVLRLLQFQLSKFRLGAEYASAFRDSLIQSTNAHLKSLYDELLAPLRDRLDAQHLLFVPHGALHYVPFHALFDGERFLIDDYTISYAPSASIYAVCAHKQVNKSGAALLMGIPDQNAPSILQEVRALSAILPHPKMFLGKAASEYILKNAGAHARLIHIATHGYFRQDSPMFSSIRMGNSHLSLYDLYQLRLPVELVTLSGCATGLNVVAAGDELIGLARGLFQAGAQSLLLSLWDVHDRSTADFMAEFYRRFRNGEDKATAVREAMLLVREAHPHPYQWAPFVLMGKYANE